MSPFHLDDDPDILTILGELKLWLEEHQESTLAVKATDKSFRVDLIKDRTQPDRPAARLMALGLAGR